METQKETENNIAQLQLLEQNIQNFLIQKQSFQTQIIEIDNALEEIKKTKGQTYRIVGAIMVSSEKEEIKEDLQNKKEIVGLRIKAIEKQENQLKEKASKLQSEVLKTMKPKEK